MLLGLWPSRRNGGGGAGGGSRVRGSKSPAGRGRGATRCRTSRSTCRRVRRPSAVITAIAVLAVLPVVLAATPAEAARSAYPDLVLADSPAVYYRLNEASGTTAADSSGNNRTGTYTAGVTLGTAGAIVADSDKAATVPSGVSSAATSSATGLPSGNTPARSRYGSSPRRPTPTTPCWDTPTSC